MASIQDLANSIATFEGFYVPGSIANRNNNPGNLRYAANQIGQENTVNGKFATFATPEEGWAALQSHITTKANSGQTLREFLYQYAPPTENNTSGYLNYVSGQLGVSADTGLADIVGSVSDSNSSDLNILGGDAEGLGVVLAVGVGALMAYIATR